MALNYLGAVVGDKKASILTSRNGTWWAVAYSKAAGAHNVSTPGTISMYYPKPTVVKCTETVNIDSSTNPGDYTTTVSTPPTYTKKTTTGPFWKLYTSVSRGTTASAPSFSGDSGYRIYASSGYEYRTGSTYGQIWNSTGSEITSGSNHILSVSTGNTVSGAMSIVIVSCYINNVLKTYYSHGTQQTSLSPAKTVYVRTSSGGVIFRTTYVKIPNTSYYGKLNRNLEVITPNAYTISDNVATKVTCGDIYLHYILSYASYNRAYAGDPILKVISKGIDVYPRLFTTSATTALCIQSRLNNGDSSFLLNNASFYGCYGVRITCDFYTGKFLSGSASQLMHLFGARASSVSTTATNLQQVSVYMRRIGDIAVSVNDNVVAPAYPYRDNQYSILRIVLDVRPSSTPTATLYKCTNWESKSFSKILDYSFPSSVKLSNTTLASSMQTLALFGESIYNKPWHNWSNYSGFVYDDLVEKDAPGILFLRFEKYNSSGTVTTYIDHYAAISTNGLATSRGFVNPNYHSERDVECSMSISGIEPNYWATSYYYIESY